MACILCHLLLIVALFSATTQAYSNVSLGKSLYAIDDNSSWTSPSGDFAFGFRRLPVPGKEDQFLLAIWFAKIPDKTIVWSANGNFPTQRESKVELTTTGQLVLTAPGGWELWKSTTENVNDNIIPSHGAMLDTGNFVIAGRSKNIWESFKNPTNTILPTQVLSVGDKLSSTILENDYKPGKFQLRLLLIGGMELNQIDTSTSNPYDAYFDIQNVSQLVFNKSGYIHMVASNGSISDLPGSFAVKGDLYYRATLNFDGTFVQYSHPKTSSNGNNSWSWSVMTTIPANICLEILGYYGSGPCGYNSFCELGPDERPICGCPPGFSLLDRNNKYSGCKLEYAQDCNQEGSIIEEDRFYFVKVDGADWPLADYEQLYPSTEFDCQQSCLRDCYCAVAIFRPPRESDSSGTCWKKKLPLSNGRLDSSAVDRRALFKISKFNHSSQHFFPNPNSGKENPKQLTIILSVLLGTSVLFNFFSVAAISLAVFSLCHRKFQRCSIVLTASDLDMNLSCFTYKDLEEATDMFKEELGRGAFGTVYKGLLAVGSVNQVAVKKLEKLVQDGEREFKTEVNVIGQTHHKNLVRLLGYCNEGEHRLLVYEFMHNGSLSSFLFGVLRPSWQQRMQIAFGIARGLVYLHDECSTQIIHCDIKPQNILLDNSFTAKISDFGLAKLLMNNQTRTLTGIRGTKGYVAPEWFRSTPVTVKVDVYSFGVMLLEIICCRKCVELEMKNAEILTDWAYDCFHEGRVENLVGDDEEARSDLKRLEKMVMVALWCVQDEPQVRPSMRVVTLMLEGVLDVSVPPCPSLFSSMYASHDAC